MRGGGHTRIGSRALLELTAALRPRHLGPQTAHARLTPPNVCVLAHLARALLEGPDPAGMLSEDGARPPSRTAVRDGPYGPRQHPFSFFPLSSLIMALADRAQLVQKSARRAPWHKGSSQTDLGRLCSWTWAGRWRHFN